MRERRVLKLWVCCAWQGTADGKNPREEAGCSTDYSGLVETVAGLTSDVAVLTGGEAVAGTCIQRRVIHRVLARIAVALWKHLKAFCMNVSSQG